MSLTAEPSHEDLPRASFTTFEESTAEDWAKIIPQISVTQSLVADRVIGLMKELETDHGGCEEPLVRQDTVPAFDHYESAAKGEEHRNQ
jgi:hypothetical protein